MTHNERLFLWLQVRCVPFLQKFCFRCFPPKSQSSVFKSSWSRLCVDSAFSVRLSSRGAVLQVHAATWYNDLAEVLSCRDGLAGTRISALCSSAVSSSMVRGWAVARVSFCTSYLPTSTGGMVVLVQVDQCDTGVRHDVVLPTCSCSAYQHTMRTK